MAYIWMWNMMEKENLEVLKKESSDKEFKCSEVLGFNNIEHVVEKS